MHAQGDRDRDRDRDRKRPSERISKEAPANRQIEDWPGRWD